MLRPPLPLALAATLVLALALAACGNRGPLYLPDPAATTEPPAANPAFDGREEGDEDETDDDREEARDGQDG